MKIIFIAAAVAAALTTPASAVVSVSVGQPGFYGQVDIGGYPQPQVIYHQPIYVEREARHRQPIYLRVPPGHAKHWSKHCGEYNACGERVYFVQDRWYKNEYVPRYEEQHRGHGDEHRNDHRDDHRNDERGNHGNDHHGEGGDHRGDH